MKNYKHLCVFDGTSAYVIPTTDLEKEVSDNDVEVIKGFNDIQEAFEFADNENESI
jgi:hypothetical protein